MATKLFALATAAGLVLATSAFAQTSQPAGQQPNDKGSNIEQKNVQSQSGSAATGKSVGSGSSTMNNGTAGSAGTTGMKNEGASPDSKAGGAPKKANQQGNN